MDFSRDMSLLVTMALNIEKDWSFGGMGQIRKIFVVTLREVKKKNKKHLDGLSPTYLKTPPCPP